MRRAVQGKKLLGQTIRGHQECASLTPRGNSQRRCSAMRDGGYQSNGAKLLHGARNRCLRHAELLNEVCLASLSLKDQPHNPSRSGVTKSIEKAVCKWLGHVRRNPYHRNMAYVDAEARETTTSWFAERLAEQRAAHSGATLNQWASEVLLELPSGPVTLLSLSVEGCALAAVVAASRQDATSWEQLALGRPHRELVGIPVVLEPAQLAEGALRVLERTLPGAVVISGLATRQALAAA